MLADRYAGVRSDIYRSAIPARHAKAEETDTSTPWEELGEAGEPDLSAWTAYTFGESFVDAVVAGKIARAAWQVAPGDNWAAALAALAAKVADQCLAALACAQNEIHHEGIELLLDATHPYAAQISHNAAQAAAQAGVDLAASEGEQK